MESNIGLFSLMIFLGGFTSGYLFCIGNTNNHLQAESQLGKSLLAGVAAALLFIIAGLSIVATAPNSSTRNMISFTEIIFYAVSSIVLITVYSYLAFTQRDQAKEIDSQTRIQEDQTSLMEAAHLPVIDFSVSDVKGDEITLRISNSGKGAGQSLEATVQFIVLEPNSGSYKLPKFPERENFYRPLTHSSGSANLLPESDGKYMSEVLIPNFDTKGSCFSVDQGIRRLERSGINSVIFQIIISYKTVIETKPRGYTALKPRKVDLSNVNSFEDMWKQSSKLVGYPPDSNIYSDSKPFISPGTEFKD